MSPVPLARARGRLELGFKRRGAETVIDALFQEGCAKARFPRREAGAFAGAVLLNTAGGMTGGDRLRQAIRWGEGTAATVAGQAAERIYRSLGDAARIETRLTVESGAVAEWLPQETILFDRARLDRDLQVDLRGDATFLGVEAIVFGRAAMGEVVRRGGLRDAWRIRRDGRLVYADALAVDGDPAAALDRPGLGRGARAVATLLYAAPAAEELVDALRAALAGAQGLAGASAWNGILVARFAAPDGAVLRRDLISALGVLRAGRPLPRVWQC
ncbi:urease accessory protein UreD [Inquilinus limosus]|uniref:urease accessory protein UreD n=1 Tax=Inquilinus limosus TaxID=171674 RepID=UPI003F5CDB63